MVFGGVLRLVQLVPQLDAETGAAGVTAGEASSASSSAPDTVVNAKRVAERRNRERAGALSWARTSCPSAEAMDESANNPASSLPDAALGRDAGHGEDRDADTGRERTQEHLERNTPGRTACTCCGHTVLRARP